MQNRELDLEIVDRACAPLMGCITSVAQKSRLSTLHPALMASAMKLEELGVICISHSFKSLINLANEQDFEVGLRLLRLGQ